MPLSKKRLDQRVKSWEENVMERTMRAPYSIEELMNIAPRRYGNTPLELDRYAYPTMSDAEMLRAATKEPSLQDIRDQLFWGVDTRSLFHPFPGYGLLGGHPFPNTYTAPETFPSGIPFGWWN